MLVWRYAGAIIFLLPDYPRQIIAAIAGLRPGRIRQCGPGVAVGEAILVGLALADVAFLEY